MRGIGKPLSRTALRTISQSAPFFAVSSGRIRSGSTISLRNATDRLLGKATRRRLIRKFHGGKKRKRFSGDNLWTRLRINRAFFDSRSCRAKLARVGDGDDVVCARNFGQLKSSDFLLLQPHCHGLRVFPARLRRPTQLKSSRHLVFHPLRALCLRWHTHFAEDDHKRSKARSVSECRIECHPERAEVYAKDEKSTRSDSGAARDFHGPTIKVLASAASDS